jgi:hypothetical protein
MRRLLSVLVLSIAVLTLGCTTTRMVRVTSAGEAYHDPNCRETVRRLQSGVCETREESADGQTALAIGGIFLAGIAATALYGLGSISWTVGNSGGD